MNDINDLKFYPDWLKDQLKQHVSSSESVVNE